MITLALETSTTRGSVAAIENGALLFSESFSANRSHSSQLFDCIERTLFAVSEKSRIGQIVVGLGPGSYSGVRIAISAAVGLSLGLNAKLLGIPSIVAMNAEEYFAIGDARRGTFYFSHVKTGEVLEGPLLLDPQALEEKIRAVSKQSPMPVFASEKIAAFDFIALNFPSAEKLARLAENGRSIIARDFLEPIYLREPHITQPKSSSKLSC